MPIYSIAQTAGNPASYSQIGFDACAMSMGNAMVGNTKECFSAYHNPARISFINKINKEFHINTFILPQDRQLYTMDIALPLKNNIYVGSYFLYASVSGIDARDVSGYPLGELSTYDLQFATTISIRPIKPIAMGMNIKYARSHLHNSVSDAETWSIDIGVLWHFNDNWTMGITVQDMLGTYQWNTSSLYGNNTIDRQSFPLRIKYGSSYHFSSKFVVNMELENRVYKANTSKYIWKDGEYTVVERPYTITDHSFIMRYGFSWEVHDYLSIRSGWTILDVGIYNTMQYHAGFSLFIPKNYASIPLFIDYAVSLSNLGYNIHIIGLRVVI